MIHSLSILSQPLLVHLSLITSSSDEIGDEVDNAWREAALAHKIHLYFLHYNYLIVIAPHIYRG
jgi:hypothetical protein